MKQRMIQKKQAELRKEENKLIKIELRLRKEELKSLRGKRNIDLDDSPCSDSDSSSDESIDIGMEEGKGNRFIE